VVVIGRVSACLARGWNHGSPEARKTKGVVLTALVVLGTFAVAWLALAALAWWHPWLAALGEVAMLATSLAIKGLRDAALDVARPLARGDLATARARLAMIVGRDTQTLDEGEITRATVETVAENTVDGITAPLFWAFIGGAPLALAYKAVNTLDSMVGYLSPQYADFGYASAKLDDLANWIPARLTAWCLWLTAWFVPGARPHGALAATCRDAPRHPSPNAGWPEAMMAHLLGVQLGGTNYYQGRVSHRATLGQPREALAVAHVFRAIRHMHAGWLAFVLLLAIVALLWEAMT
jgi:adenosylcobinamide-phosphate synthase